MEAQQHAAHWPQHQQQGHHRYAPNIHSVGELVLDEPGQAECELQELAQQE